MISVIVPIYNVEKYLSTCIESILNQTYKKLEILLIDDGSTDKSGEICDEYTKQDNRCIAIHQPNKGISEARNTGLKHATGEYISFIDGDDYIHPQMLEILYEALQKGDYDFSMILYKKAYAQEQFQFITEYTTQELNQSQLIYSLYNNLSQKSNTYQEMNFHVVWNKLYKKTLINDTPFIQTVAEDAVFNNTIYLKCKKVIVINNEIYYWVQRQNSITHQGINQTYINRILSYYQCLKNIPENNSTYRAAALEKLYKIMIIYNFNVHNSYLKIKLKEIRHSVKTKTMAEFLSNQYISRLHKISILLTFYFPFIFTTYIRLYTILLKIKSIKRNMVLNP